MGDEKIDVKVRLGLDGQSEQQVKKDVSRVTKELENQVNYEKQRKQAINDIAKELNTTASVIEKSLKLTEKERREREKVLQLSKKNEASEQKQLKNLEVKLKLFKESQMRSIESLQSGNLKGLYDKNALDSFQKSLSQLSIDTPDLENKMRLLGSEFKNIKNGAQNSSKAISVASKETASFATGIKDAAIKFGLWSAVTVAYYGAINAIKEGINTVRELDTALVELKKVTNETEQVYDSYMQKSYELAKATNSTITDTIKATSAFARMGYQLNEIDSLVTSALTLQKIGDGIDSIDESTGSLIATLKGFNMDASETTKIIDILNELSNNYAVDTKSLAEGIKRVSATFSQSGNSIEETTALLTGADEIIQDITKSATGLRTVSQRIRGIGEDGENLIPKLKEVYTDMQTIFGTKVTVDIEDVNGNLRSTIDIMRDMANVNDILTDKQRALVGEVSAGKRQVQTWNAVLSNWETVENALVTATNSAGSASRELVVYADSIEGKLNELARTSEEFWHKFLDSQVVKDTIEVLTLLISGLDTLSETIGSTNLVLLTIIVSLGIFKKDLLVTAYTSIAKFVQGLTGMTSTAIGGKLAIEGITMATHAMTLGITLVIGGLIKLIDYNRTLKEEFKQQNQEMEQLADNYKNLSDEEKKLLKIRIQSQLQEKDFKGEIESLDRIKELNNKIIYLEKQKMEKRGDVTRNVIESMNSEIQMYQNEIDELKSLVKLNNMYVEIKEEEEYKLSDVGRAEKKQLELYMEDSNVKADLIAIQKKYADNLKQTSVATEELTDKEIEHQEMMKFSIMQLDTLSQKYPEYSETVIEYQIKQTKAMIVEIEKQLSALEIQKESLIELSKLYIGMSGVADDATFNMSRAILPMLKGEGTTGLQGAKNRLQELLDLQEKYFGKDKKSSSKTKEATAYYKELAKIAEIENKIAILKTKESIEIDESKKIDLIKEQIEKTKELQNALHVLNEARREDKKLLKEGTEDYLKLEDAIAKTSAQWETQKKAIYDMNNAIKDLAKKYLEDLKSAYSDVEDKIITILESQYKKEKELAKDNYDANLKNLEDTEEQKTDALKKEYEKRKKLIEDEINATEELIKARIKLLNEGYKTEDFNKAMAESDKKIAELNKKKNELSLSEGLEERGKVKELETQISEEQAKKQDLITNRTREKQIGVLEDELDKFKDTNNKKLSAIEKEYNNKEKLREDDLDSEKKKLKTEYDLLVDNIDEKLTKESLYAEARAIIENKSLSELSTMFRNYINEYDKGFSLLGDSIENNFISKIKKATALLSTLNNMTNSSSYNTSSMSGNPLNMTQSDFNEYIENKRIAEKYGRGTDEFHQASMNNSLIRKNYGILSDEFSLSDLMKANSLNIQNISSQTTISKIPPITKSNGLTIAGNLLNIEGNVDKNTLPQIKQQADRMTDVLSAFVKNGGRLIP